MSIFTFSLNIDGFVLAQVRLPEYHLQEFKTRLLIGVKVHEYVIPHAYFDEVNKSYPFEFASVNYNSICMRSLIPGFRTVTFITE